MSSLHDHPLSTDQSRSVRAAVLLALTLLLLTASGCGTSRASRYGQSRMYDLIDVAPVSLASGYGLSVHARVTPLLGIGAGYADVYRFGFDDGRFGPYWIEKIYAVPLVSDIRQQSYPVDGDRWPGGDLASKLEHDRYRANSLLVIPGLAGDGGLWPPLAGDTEWHWPRYSPWDLVSAEVGFVAGFAGLRAGVSLFQVGDFVAGLIGFDPAGDDVKFIAPPEEGE